MNCIVLYMLDVHLSLTLQMYSTPWKVDMATMLWTGWSEVWIVVGARDFYSSCQCPDWLWGPPNLLFNAYLGSFWGGGEVKQSEHEVNHSPPSRAKVKNEWSCTSTPHIYLHAYKGTTLYIFFPLFNVDVLSYLFTLQKTASITSWIQDPCRSFNNLTIRFYFPHRTGLHVLVT
jgi:hypothetical protein